MWQKALDWFLHVKQTASVEGQVPLLSMPQAIEEVKNAWQYKFQIVDGMKGAGKSTAMAQLCVDHIRSGQPALYLQFSKLDQAPGNCIIDYVLKHPQLIVELADKMFTNNYELIIVVDDLHRCMEGSDASQILIALWLAVGMGTKVIFTATTT